MRDPYRSTFGPVTGAYRWIMLPYRVLAVMGDAFVRWLGDLRK
jgi:hypothetical protein